MEIAPSPNIPSFGELVRQFATIYDEMVALKDQSPDRIWKEMQLFAIFNQMQKALSLESNSTKKNSYLLSLATCRLSEISTAKMKYLSGVIQQMDTLLEKMNDLSK